MVLPTGSHFDPPRGGSKSHHKNRSVKNGYKIDKLSEHVQKSDSRGYPEGDQRGNIFHSISGLGTPGAPRPSPRAPRTAARANIKCFFVMLLPNSVDFLMTFGHSEVAVIVETKNKISI